MFRTVTRGLCALVGVPTDRRRQRRRKRPQTVREAALARVREDGGKVMTAERAELIRNAMAVHRAKQTVLADLDDADKQKLVATALRALLNEGRGDPADRR